MHRHRAGRPSADAAPAACRRGVEGTAWPPDGGLAARPGCRQGRKTRRRVRPSLRGPTRCERLLPPRYRPGDEDRLAWRRLAPGCVSYVRCAGFRLAGCCSRTPRIARALVFPSHRARLTRPGRTVLPLARVPPDRSHGTRGRDGAPMVERTRLRQRGDGLDEQPRAAGTLVANGAGTEGACASTHAVMAGLSRAGTVSLSRPDQPGVPIEQTA